MEQEQIINIINSLNVCEVEKLKADGMTNSAFFNNDVVDVEHLQDTYKWYFKAGEKKFSKINCGGSGCFMLENATGELFNIKGCGVPDYNKKKKADIGNINSVDVKVLHSKRWNYLR